MSCPQIWNLEQEKDREKEKVAGRPAKLNEKLKGDRDLERDIKNKGDIFLLEEQHENFVAAVTKWEMLAATNARWKLAAVKKSEQEHVYEISPIKLVTKKFLEVSRCSHAKQRQRNVQKKCAARAAQTYCCFSPFCGVAFAA